MIKSILCLTSIIVIASTDIAFASSGNSASVLFRGVQIAHRETVKAKSTSRIKPSGKYIYTITGNVVGTGDLAALAPKAVPISVFMNGLKPGSGKSLKGIAINTSGALPYTAINKTFNGERNITGFGKVFLSLTMKADIAADGTINFTINKVNLKSKREIKGGLTVQNGKLLVQVAPTFEIPTAKIAALENSGSIVLNVRRFGSLDATATVAYTTQDISAVAGVDYTPVSGTLKFRRGESVKLVTIPLIDNATEDAARSFSLVISSPSANAQLGRKIQSTVSIRDDE